MTALLEKFGVRVPYPENWSVDGGSSQQYSETWSVQSPEGAFWSLSVHDGPENLTDLAATVLDTIREEYGDVETEVVEETIADTDLHGFNLTFYCQELLIQAQCRVFLVDGRKFIVLCQGEDRDFDRQHAVFDAMTRSVIDRSIAERISRSDR
jgi:hypothetical protein